MLGMTHSTYPRRPVPHGRVLMESRRAAFLLLQVKELAADELLGQADARKPQKPTSRNLKNHRVSLLPLRPRWEDEGRVTRGKGDSFDDEESLDESWVEKDSSSHWNDTPSTPTGSSTTHSRLRTVSVGSDVMGSTPRRYQSPTFRSLEPSIMGRSDTPLMMTPTSLRLNDDDMGGASPSSVSSIESPPHRAIEIRGSSRWMIPPSPKDDDDDDESPASTPPPLIISGPALSKKLVGTHLEEGPIRGVLKRKFSWKNYPALENYLIEHRPQYMTYSSQLNYTAEQKRYNNRLTQGLLDLAAQEGFVFDGFTFAAVRDRIRCYYKSFVQAAKKKKRKKKMQQQKLRSPERHYL